MQTAAGFVEHVDRKDCRVVFADDPPVFERQHGMQLMNVDAPDDRIVGIHHLKIILCHRKMQSHHGREGPVQKAGGQSVMLPQDHLVPDRLLDRRLFQYSVLGKIEQHGGLKQCPLIFAVPLQARRERKRSIRFAAVDEQIPVAAQIFPVFLLRNHTEKIIHSMDLNIMNHKVTSAGNT